MWCKYPVSCLNPKALNARADNHVYKFVLPLEAMEPHIRSWHEWMQACGSFYDYKDTDGVGRLYEVHRCSIHPAMRVCWEWGSLLLNDKTQVVCGTQECTDWLEGFLAQSGFMAAAQATEGIWHGDGRVGALGGRGCGERAH